MPSKAEREKQAMSEYGEPWRYLPDDQWGIIADCNGGVIVETTSGDILESDTARIVACVNALAGIPNPEAWVAAANNLADAARAIAGRGILREHDVRDDALVDALSEFESLTAPSDGPQQK